MSRKLILAAAATLLFAGTDVVALGLGEIRAYSGLNQPFQGEIALYDVKPEDQDALQIALASQAAFDQAGIERYYDLTKLKFTLETSTSGELVITVTSREPIREPYLDMLVEVYWPQGQLLKEFTVLLEPPERMTPAPARSRTAASHSVTTPTSGDTGDFPLVVGPISAGSSLWKVARNHAPAGATAAQTALALYRNNQDAFTRGNINRLISGRTLIIPTREELLALDATAAEREFTSAVQGGATPRAPLTVVPTDNAQLRLLGARAPATAPLPTAASQPDPVATRLEQDLLIALETSESTRQEAQELRQRVQELETQLVTIQQQLQSRPEASANTELVTAVSTMPTPAAVPTPTALVPTSETLPPLAVAAAPPPPLPPLPVTTLDAPEVPPVLPEFTPLPIPSADITPAPAASPATPVTAPAATPPAEDTSAWHALMLPMAGIAGLVALGMLGFAWWRTRQREAAEAAAVEAEPDDDSFSFSNDFAGGPATALLPNADDDFAQTAFLPVAVKASAPKASAPETPLVPATALAPTRRLEDEEEPETALSLMSALSDFEAETDTVDPLSEADIYITYGKYAEAQALLLKELQHAPNRLDLKFKLAEACAGAKNLPGLTNALQSIETLKGQQVNPQQWQRLQDVAAQLQKIAPALIKERDSAFTLDIDTSTPPIPAPATVPAPLTLAKAKPALPLDHNSELDLDALLPHSTFTDLDDAEDSRFMELAHPPRPIPPPPRVTPAPTNVFEDDDLGQLLLQPSLSSEMVTQTTASAPLSLPVAPLPIVAPLPAPVVPSLLNIAPKSAPLPKMLELPDSFDLELNLSPSLLSLPDKDTSELSETALTWQPNSEVWDEIKTKLDLAQAYADMDDPDAARDILNEVLAEGNAEQKAAAQQLLDRIK